MGKISDALTYGLTIRESATDGSDFTNPAADYRRLFLGEDGNLHVKDSAGTVTDIGGAAGSVATDAIWDAAGDLAVGTGANTAGRLAVGAAGTILRSNGTTAAWGSGLRDFASVHLATGDKTLNNTSWTNLDNALDMTLDAVSGETIEVSFSGSCNGANVGLAIDVATIVAASPVNYISGGGGASDLGVGAWYMGSNGANGFSVGGSILYTLVAGDISSSTVTLRYRFRSSASTNKVLNCTTALPVHVWAKNLGTAPA